ncbi:FkbM family methyltransferase [Erythrobacter sp. SCSIO 43205]|uniref:FkbM family methyltransferase n=1 Tax=Erythrobacter sp. SCSIO 43205 TaxID=2779361 RepID=UPI001CA7F18D|nr:FkbM family methyltransferase [Erythrobacter sp. SCSIO 43205]UAB78967.1 FkbM family methyltransferase [Erythrobacter sp. SCSIO 43205]
MRDFRRAPLIAAEIEDDRMAELRHLLTISESQFLQDVFAALTHGGKRNGYFVEVGVGSGRDISNTYMLEKHFDWDGLLVEPNRASHETIRQQRSAQLDLRAAAKTSGNVVTFEEYVGHGVHSRVVGAGVGHELNEVEKRTYDVETISLTDLFVEKGVPEVVDFMSLDTEGGEADILRGLDMNKYTVGVIAVEHNLDAATQADLDLVLMPQGFRKVLPHVSAVDAWYVHDSVKADGCSWGV